ncbi:helix-turn-helix domain-containing protein [Xaviernesmea rhizosphaerae]|uniref:helix-turn-helix domain-containing protein n=1 Tax=Xaviernesmea rhizosphaerae TaxID=1672749 RepID=UPI0024782D97|nr:helix-turn-helix domain-containing protein [Xaviernesmea rhizosphaerae]
MAAVTGRMSAPAPHQPPLRPVPGVKGTAAALSERCSAVQTLVQEMAALASERVAMRRSRRRSRCHVRQIAMYLCHVVLQMSLTDIGAGFGRDRTTAGHACNVVEDLRDDPVYDAFLSTLERVVQAVFPRAAQGGAIDA